MMFSHKKISFLIIIILGGFVLNVKMVIFGAYKYEHIDVKNKMDGLDEYLDAYIMKNFDIM